MKEGASKFYRWKILKIWLDGGKGLRESFEFILNVAQVRFGLCFYLETTLTEQSFQFPIVLTIGI